MVVKIAYFYGNGCQLLSINWHNCSLFSIILLVMCNKIVDTIALYLLSTNGVQLLVISLICKQ